MNGVAIYSSRLPVWRIRFATISPFAACRANTPIQSTKSCLPNESSPVSTSTAAAWSKEPSSLTCATLAIRSKSPARYEAEGADELVFLDITASHEGRAIMLDVVRRTAEVVFMPLTVGGGIRSLEDIRALLNAGSDKVSINSAAVRDPEFVRQAARRFGNQCIVVNIDPKRIRHGDQERWEVHINGGRIGTGLEAVAWAREVERLGAGEIVLTCMDADGTQNGYDLEITAAVSRAVSIPVVASGGAGRPEHFCDAVLRGLRRRGLGRRHFPLRPIHDRRRQASHARNVEFRFVSLLVQLPPEFE